MAEWRDVTTDVIRAGDRVRATVNYGYAVQTYEGEVREVGMNAEDPIVFTDMFFCTDGHNVKWEVYL